jgi:hypothetical protein
LAIGQTDHGAARESDQRDHRKNDAASGLNVPKAIVRKVTGPMHGAAKAIDLMDRVVKAISRMLGVAMAIGLMRHVATVIGQKAAAVMVIDQTTAAPKEIGPTASAAVVPKDDRVLVQRACAGE